MNILLVEDDKSLSKTITQLLQPIYNVDIVDNGNKAIYLAETADYDLILLDLHLPDQNGCQVLQTLRSDLIITPVLIITSINQLKSKIKAFKLGADDYLVKPFACEELLARISAITRRKTKQKQEVITIDGLQLHTTQNFVSYQGREIDLARREYQLLKFFMLNHGKLLSHNLIYEHVWEAQCYECSNTIAVHVRRLRQKIDWRFNIKLINTIHGGGYKFGR